MNFEKKMKKRIDKKLNEIVPNGLEKEKTFPKWAKIALPFVAASIVIAFAIPIINSGNLENVISKLNGTYVDMEDVSAFAVWNAPTKKEKAKLSHVSFLKHTIENDELNDQDADDENTEETIPLTPEQEWELDYDWDPTKANVLVSLDENGGVKEVVYERTNNKGVVRQDTLGNAAAVYVSKNFTYVMYVNDSEWEFWKDINFAQESVTFNGFHCHHESMQTIVIHNKTGKVFALKDLIPQVSEISGALNYTMQVQTTYDDYLIVVPMYGVGAGQWFRVKYDEESGLYYEHVEFDDFRGYNFSTIRKDKYNQEYIYSENLPLNYSIHQNSLLTGLDNSLLYGSDNRMYLISQKELKVFGENFELFPIEDDLEVTMEGLSHPIILTDYSIAYHVEDGYLYSMFGDVWKIESNCTLVKQSSLEGSFPFNELDGYMIGTEIIAMIDACEHMYDNSVHGKLVRLDFGLENGVPSVRRDVILNYAASFEVQNHRMTVWDGDYKDEDGHHINFYRVIVNDNNVNLKLIAYGMSEGGYYGVTSLASPITEPLDLNE